MLLLAAFFWGSGNLANMTVLQDRDPFPVVVLHHLVAEVVIAPMVLPEMTRGMAPAWFRSVLPVGVFFGVAVICQQWGYQTSTVTNSSSLVNANCMLTPHLALLIVGARPGPCTALAAAVMLLGALSMSGILLKCQPMNAEETIDPVRDMPKGILLALGTLILTGFLIMLVNPALPDVGSHELARSGEPMLMGFRALFPTAGADVLELVDLSGLVTSFHAILFAQGRQILALSRSGYLPRGLSVANGDCKTPDRAMLAGSGLGLGIMIALRLALGEDAGPAIGGTLLHKAVFGAMLSYISRAAAYLMLRRTRSAMPRPFKSPVGGTDAWIFIVISSVTLASQVQDPAFLKGTTWVVVWLGLGIPYFRVIARHALVLSPEARAALENS